MKGLQLPYELGVYRGTRYYRFFVWAGQSDLDWEDDAMVEVVAATTADACNLVRDELALRVTRPVTIECYGPRGGMTHRWIGWDSLIGAKLGRGQPRQLTFSFLNFCLPP